MARGTALWESLMGKPRGKATDPLIQAKGSVTLLLQLERKRTCRPPLEMRTDSPGETQKYPKIHVSTGEEFSGPGTDAIQSLNHRDTAATAQEESKRAGPHSRQGLTPLRRLRSTRSSMSALERNPQVPAPTPHNVLGPDFDGRGIPRGPRSTRMGTGLS